MTVGDELLTGLVASGLALRGEDGQNGIKGDKGDKGPKGDKGNKGETGADGVGPDEKVKLSASDPKAGFLADKLEGGRGIYLIQRDGEKGKRLVIEAAHTGAVIGVGGASGGGSGAVDSVNGQTGVVVVDASEVPFTPAGTIAATDVQAAIEEVAAEAGTGTLADVLTAGGDPDGNPITGELEIEPTDNTLNQLVTILTPVGFRDFTGDGLVLKLIDRDSGVTVFEMSAYGDAVIRSPDGSARIDLFGVNPARTGFVSSDAGIFVRSNVGTLGIGPEGSGNPVLLASVLAGVNLGNIAAPANDDINTSTASLWFDDTNGAASPKWKGKSADGTVESGSLGDQTAAEVPFTPAGTIAATNVQAAIEEVAAEAGSGTTARELILNPGIGTTVAGDGTQYPLPWTKLSGSDLLDLSDPLIPTIVETGIYALNVNAICTEDVLDLTAQMFFGLDAADGDAYQDSHVPLRSATGNPRVSHSLTYYLEAGSAVTARVAQNTGGDLDFYIDAMIQRIS